MKKTKRLVVIEKVSTADQYCSCCVCAHHLVLEARFARYEPGQLTNLYHTFNKSYFDGALPNIEVTEKKSKNVLGAAEATVRYRNGRKTNRVPPEDIETKGIWISNTYTMTPEQVEKILLHEMIHVWCYSQGIVRTIGDPGHGMEFEKMRKQVSAASGYDVPKKESSDILAVDNVDSMVHYGAKFTEKHGGNERVYYTRLTKNAYDDLEAMKKQEERLRAPIERFTTQGSMSMFRMPERRKIGSWGSFSDPELAKKLEDSITFIETIPS